ncbi:MAG: SCO family protein [Bdellovibrionaceae bacterium]|nr:SCO family protein [Pseudobdellovibrionaceae bacterium]
MTSFRWIAGCLGFSLALGAGPVLAQRSTPGGMTGQPAPMVATERPKELEGVGIEEKLGQPLDLSLVFRDERGQEVTLGSFYDGKTPVVISPVYYSCPGLCNFHLNGFTEGLKGMDWSVGSKFKVIAVSFDPKETPDLAEKKKATYMKLYGRPGTEDGWHFLTGSEESIKKLTDSVGFKYRWNEDEKEWAHASAAIVTTPRGEVSRYLPGIQFEPKNIRLALVEAGEGKVGGIIDQLVLYCFQYNPHQSAYTIYAFNIMKLGGALMVLVLAIWLLPFFWRARARGKV